MRGIIFEMKIPSTNDYWDQLYSDTHGGTDKATWELDEEELPEHEVMDDPYED